MRKAMSDSLGPVWRDARQIHQSDAFFRGERGPGPVAIASWTWPSLIGRPAALAFLAGCAAAANDALLRENLRALLAVWPTSLFTDPAARFRVVETTAGELPFALPVDPDGYAHHAVLWRRRRFFVSNHPVAGRIIYQHTEHSS